MKNSSAAKRRKNEKISFKNIILKKMLQKTYEACSCILRIGRIGGIKAANTG
jgi:hypothetical protein